MSTDPPPPLTFDALRARAIGAAQSVSGDIWTDYNLHDPGVTLLEQTAFALSELAYQGDHAPRDLLTGENGHFDTNDLALFDADLVLPGRPVTLTDLASCLSELNTLERVFVSEGPAKGLIDLIIIPRDSVDPAEQRSRITQSWRDQVVADVKTRFNDHRLLCSAIHSINIANAVPISLHGVFALDATTQPEQVIAEAIHRITLALKGLALDAADGSKITGTTRHDVFENPAAIWPKIPAGTRSGRPLDIALPALHGIAGLARVTQFDLRDPITGAVIEIPLHTRKAAFYKPELPAQCKDFTLTATRDGASVQLDNDTIHEELGRLQAARIAARNTLRDAQDWDVQYPGKPRDLTRGPVDKMLPASYQIAERKTQAKGSLTRYRTMIDTHLDRMTAPVDRLDATYVKARNINLDDPTATRERIAMLDYLIALHGEEMPVCDASYMHKYRGAGEQLAWAITWREGYLANLPNYNRFAGTAHARFGFLARLAHLADLQVGGATPDEALPINNNITPPATTITPEDVILPVRPLDTFVIQDDDVAPLSLAKLSITCPWIIDGQITNADICRAAQPSAYIVARNRKGDWDVLYQPMPGGGFHGCGTHRSRSMVNDWANRVLKTFAMLNQQAEQVWCIEDISLRKTGANFAPFQCTALMPGWTARTQDPSYRHYVEDLILRLAPAHIYVKLLWLTPDQMTQVAPLLAGPETDLALRQTLRQTLRDWTAG